MKHQDSFFVLLVFLCTFHFTFMQNIFIFLDVLQFCIKEGREDKLLFVCVSDSIDVCLCVQIRWVKSILSRARNYTTYIQQFIHSSRYHNVVMKSSYRYVRRKKKKNRKTQNSPSPSVSCSAVLFSTFVVGDVTCPQYYISAFPLT